MSVTETFAAGDHKELVFKMVHTVLVKIKMLASGSGTQFGENCELWQEGERKYTVHVVNGAYMLPGTYDLHLPNRLTPYVKPGIVVTDEDEQSFEITIPVGHVTVIYQKADGTRENDKRCFVGRGPTGSGVFKMSGKKHPLLPGTYNVIGWYGDPKHHANDYQLASRSFLSNDTIWRVTCIDLSIGAYSSWFQHLFLVNKLNRIAPNMGGITR